MNLTEKPSLQFLERLRDPLSWSELSYGYSHELLNPPVVIAIADKALNTAGHAIEQIIALAIASPMDSLRVHLDEITNTINEGQSKESVEKRWAIILTAWTVESDSDPSSLLDRVECVYSDFNYPEELRQFIRYMPMNGPDLGSKEANEANMINRLNAFVHEIVAREGQGESGVGTKRCRPARP
jgi:hypothetical protein